MLAFAVVKRIDPRLLNTWGHWWIELDGEESYGWWPSPCPMGWRGALLGSDGCLNGIDGDNGGTLTRDAYHGEEPDHSFHPTLVVPKSDDQVRAEIRAFARSYRGGFRWQWWWLRQPADNCRTFQDRMFEAVGLHEEAAFLYTRGSGCPFMYPFRRVKWRTVDAICHASGRLRRSLGRERAAAGTATGTPLTDPKARARARAGGRLLPGEGQRPG